jgi:hypothetical protein
LKTFDCVGMCNFRVPRIEQTFEYHDNAEVERPPGCAPGKVVVHYTKQLIN